MPAMTPHQLKTQQQRHRQQIQNYQHQQLAQELQDTHDYTQHTHGETSPQHAQSLLNLGAWHTANGDYAAAEPLLKQAVHIQRQHNHPNALAQALNQLAINQLHTAQAGEAQRNLEEALTLATEADLTAQIHDDLGNALYTQENLAQALHHYEQAAARFERLYGMHHPKTAQAYTHAAAVYRQQEHAQEALSILQHTTQILETTPPPPPPSTPPPPIPHPPPPPPRKNHPQPPPHNPLAHCELAAAHDALKHYPQAAEHYRQAAQHLARSVGTDHPLYAKYLCRHAYHHLQTHRPEQALTQLHQALLIFMNTYEDDHPIIHNTIQNIVLLMMMTGNDHPD